MIQSHMKLNRSFCLSVLGPRKQRRGQLDQGGIQRDHLAIEAEPVLRHHVLGAAEKLEEDLFEQASRLVLIGSCQRRPRNRSRSEVVELVSLGIEVRYEIAKAASPSELAHGEGEELIPAAQRAQLSTLMVPLSGSAEFMSWQNFEDLGENGRIVSQGLISSLLSVVCLEPPL
jgi:hypothetical protein